ncbi:MAG: penicillin-binding transpeptidase domain-containing protein, partial [Chloroflexota bacterium]
MAFTREINRLMFGLLLAFFAIVGSASYWAVVGADSILLRDDNPRLVEAEIAIQRGSIYDADNHVLAESVLVDEQTVRQYPHEAMNSIVGYFSFRYGVAGAEAAYNDYLRGEVGTDPLATIIEQDVLHLPAQGADVRLTLDLDVQEAIADALSGRTGAVVVLSVPDGAVLGMMSLPTYDPNTLDAEWDNLIVQEGDLFFNRALQGQYQPGGMLQTPLMVAGILTDQPFDVLTADANRPLMIDDRTLTCAVEPPQPDLTYSQAYAYGCPVPFSLLANDINPTSLQNIVSAFRLDAQPTLAGFIVEPETTDKISSSATEEATPESTPTVDANQPTLSLVEDLVGQGDLTINPLNMATVASAVINAGNAPQPFALNAYRLPEAPENAWITVDADLPTQPLMTATAARRLRQLMLSNVEIDDSASVLASSASITIGGHTALAVSGDETQAWFIGFTTVAE